MADNSTIARPYAKAAFASARDAGKLAEWSALLAVAAAAVRDPGFAPLIGNPNVPTATLAAILAELAGDDTGAAGRGLLDLLAERRRLALLPDIHARFEALRAESENRVDVELVSARALTDAQRKRFAQALRKRLGREVVLNERVDASIVGGAVIRAGDLVIDGSVRGRLEKLAATLAN